MEALSLCLFFAVTVTVVVQAEGYPFTKEEAIHLDDTIRAVVDDMLARQASVYDARITKLEADLASVYDARITKLEANLASVYDARITKYEALHKQQNRKIRILETREKRQRKIIQDLTSMVSELKNPENFRHNERTLPWQIRETNNGKVTVEPKAVQLKNRELLLHDLKPDSGRKTRGSSRLNFRAIAASENVAFTAYLDHDVDHMSVGHTVKFNKVHLNDGNGYNTFTGVFIVPVSGVYLFTYHWTSYYRNTALELLVDSVQQAAAVAHPVSNNLEAMGGQTVIISVAAGQAVWIEDKFTGDGELFIGTTAQYATFAGALLY